MQSNDNARTLQFPSTQNAMHNNIASGSPVINKNHGITIILIPMKKSNAQYIEHYQQEKFSISQFEKNYIVLE